MKPQRLIATETRDGIQVGFRYEYEGKLPTAPQRKKAALEFARRVVEEMESEMEAVGFAEDSPKQVRMDEYVTKPNGRR